ncbi:MAG: type II secretion system protein [Alphaproteobacteria bacterium]|nr:type II secretion system protein [Alphaproteobacteria bacterium]
MKKYIENNNFQNGFTLVEISISIVILGMMLATAAPLYKKYQQNKKIERSELSLLLASNAVGGFKSIYGRYPCPAPSNAVPGSANYGYEDCTATPPGIRTAVSVRTPALANPNILIGTLPFRTLNLQESDIYDGYKNRLTYAVTQSQTVDTTYDSALGGISLVDRNSGSIITPSDSGHFVIISNGENDEGAFSYDGIRKGACANALAKDNENCNDDAVFRVSQIEQDFDDRAVYSTSIDVTPWQYGNITSGPLQNDNDIFLRRGDRIVLGQTGLITDPTLITSETFEARALSGDGVIKAETATNLAGVALTNSTGAVVTDRLCDDLGTNCFSPQIIGGPLGAVPASVPPLGSTTIANTREGVTTPSGGLFCNQGVMVGIENGLPICSDTIDFSCPSGSHMTGFTAAGVPQCDSLPASSCLDTTITTTCGETKILTGTSDGNHSTALSGQCYMLNNFNPVAAQAAINSVGASASLTAKTNALQSYINGLNSTPRTQIDCTNAKSPPDPIHNLVRDAYLCDNGSFITTPVRTHERMSYNTSWPGSVLANWQRAETNGVSYGITNDPNNLGNRHDCWCREDYRIDSTSCPTGTTAISGSPPPNTGNLEVSKHRCPQTDDHVWYNVWGQSPPSPSLCLCTPGATTQPETCDIYFSSISGTTIPSTSVIGNVQLPFNVSCSANNPTLTPSGPADTSGCTCPGLADQITTTACPAGDVNSFTLNGRNYVNTATVTTRSWVCPTGVGGNVANVSQVGRWGTPVTHVEPCLCNSSQMGTDPVACPPGQNGNGTVYETQKSCPSGAFVRTGVIISGPDCRTCSWKSSGAGSVETYATLNPVGSACPCSATTYVGSCHDTISATQNTVWSNSCYCSED